MKLITSTEYIGALWKMSTQYGFFIKDFELVNTRLSMGTSNSPISYVQAQSLTDGSYMVSWQKGDGIGDGNEQEVWARLYNSNGTPLDSPFQISGSGENFFSSSPSLFTYSDRFFVQYTKVTSHPNSWDSDNDYYTRSYSVTNTEGSSPDFMRSLESGYKSKGFVETEDKILINANTAWGMGGKETWDAAIDVYSPEADGTFYKTLSYMVSKSPDENQFRVSVSNVGNNKIIAAWDTPYYAENLYANDIVFRLIDNPENGTMQDRVFISKLLNKDSVYLILGEINELSSGNILISSSGVVENGKTGIHLTLVDDTGALVTHYSYYSPDENWLYATQALILQDGNLLVSWIEEVKGKHNFIKSAIFDIRLNRLTDDYNLYQFSSDRDYFYSDFYDLFQTPDGDIKIILDPLNYDGTEILQSTFQLYDRSSVETTTVDASTEVSQSDLTSGTVKYIGDEGVNTLTFAVAKPTTFDYNNGSDKSLFVSDTYGNSLLELDSIERLQFTDTTIALDTDGSSSAGAVYRLYKAAFDRAPDNGGLGFWISKVDNGTTLEEMASGFLDSAEFKSLYGENPSDQEFLTQLYKNVLDREPDQSGQDYWLGEFANGLSKEKALANFSESNENQINVLGQIENGFEYTLWMG